MKVSRLELVFGHRNLRICRYILEVEVVVVTVVVVFFEFFEVIEQKCFIVCQKLFCFWAISHIVWGYLDW